MSKADQLIESLGLVAHPEGGYYRELYRSDETVNTANGTRNLMTSIYFLLRKGERSHFHRIKSDEHWYFHASGTLLLHEISADGKLSSVRIGGDLANGDRLHYCVKAGHWFGSEPIEGDFVLVSCAVAPGFDFQDFELAKAEELKQILPGHDAFLTRMCLPTD